MNTTDRYAKIRKALEMKPTPGPWKVGDQNGHCGISISSNDNLVATAYLRLITSRAKWGAEHFELPENRESVANARLIAACDPDTISELLAERDTLAEEVERLRKAMELARAVLARSITAGHNVPGPAPEDIEKSFWALDAALKEASDVG